MTHFVIFQGMTGRQIRSSEGQCDPNQCELLPGEKLLEQCFQEINSCKTKRKEFQVNLKDVYLKLYRFIGHRKLKRH